jgi:hypothetical protein
MIVHRLVQRYVHPHANQSVAMLTLLAQLYHHILLPRPSSISTPNQGISQPSRCADLYLLFMAHFGRKKKGSDWISDAIRARHHLGEKGNKDRH